MIAAKNQKELAEINSKFLDALIAHEGVKNDVELSRLLGMTAPDVSKRRKGRLGIGSSMMVKVMQQNPTWTLSKVENLFKGMK